MARPPLRIGTHGEINSIRETPEGVKPEKWRAYARFRDADGVTRKVERWDTTDNKARRALRDALGERRARFAGGGLTDASRFAEAAAIWIEKVRAARKGTTYDGYRSYLNSIVLPAIGELRLRELTTGRLEDFMDTQRHLSVHTRRGVKSVLSGVLQMVVQRDILAANPAREMSRIEGGPKRKPTAFTPEQLLDFLAKVDADKVARQGDLPDLLRFLFGTGARLGEALGLRWCDVNLGDQPVTIDGETIPPRSIWINGNLVSIAGRGLVRHEGKTFAANRKLGMPQFIHALLVARRHPDAREDEPVFPGGTLTWRQPSVIQRSVLRLRQRIGYPTFTTHVGRKTVATMLDEAGHTARKVADHLGHSSVSVTQNTYFARGMANPAAAAALDAVHSPS